MSFQGQSTLTLPQMPTQYERPTFEALRRALESFIRHSANPGPIRVTECLVAADTNVLTAAARQHVVGRSLGDPVQRLETYSAAGSPRTDTYQNRVATTNATLTTIHTVTVPASTTLAVHAVVVARRTGGAAGTAEDGARYDLRAVYKNVAGTATIIGAITKIADEDQAAWDATLTPSAGTVLIQVQGAASNNVTWLVTVETWPVST